MVFGIDYAYGRPTPLALRRAGVKFVCRYLSTPGNPKNLDRVESEVLRRAGFKVVTVFETTAGRALAGRAGGIADARSASAQLAELGAPGDAPVYFAVDFDATPGQQAAINGYLLGAASVLGAKRVGVYGSFYVVKRALDANACRYAWQTYAWSGGQFDPRTHLYQYRNGQRLDGVSCDFNHAFAEDFGQWYAPTPGPAPTPPAPHPHAVAFPKDDTFWTWLRWRTGSGEFEPFGPRHAPVRPNVPQRVPAAWWRALNGFLQARPV